MNGMSPDVVYVDARALQDPDYRFRGVGHHSTSLIEALRRRRWPNQRPHFIAVIDDTGGQLAPEHRELFDSVSTEPKPKQAGHSVSKWFLSLSPMTHDPVWAAAFLTDHTLYRIAIFYDLIPLEFPERYLAAAPLRMDYFIALAWLRRYDTFAAISQFSANGLIERVAVNPAKVFVSGVAVRPALEPIPGTSRILYNNRRTIVVSGGGDPRKNPECAMIAHAESHILREANVTLSVFGNYPDSMRADFRTLYAKHGGRPQDLNFLPHLSDASLHETYRKGLVTVVPSRSEGFSIPIIESSAAGTPVLASNAGAHSELAKDANWRFNPDKPAELREMLEQLISDEEAWSNLSSAQAQLWRDYTLERVGHAFTEGVLARAPERVATPAIRRGARPSIAVLTPLPPAFSGIADYSAATLRPLTSVVDVHMFTASGNAHWDMSWKSLNDISSAQLSNKDFDATLSVIGNSFHHKQIFQYLLDYGGGCIAHDARQIDFYYHDFGIDRAKIVAAKELGRSVSTSELDNWIQNQHFLPTLFLSEIVEASSPLIVHSITTAREIKRLYDKQPIVLPFAQYRPSVESQLKPEIRRSMKAKLGFPEDSLVLVTFGIVSSDKAPHQIIHAVKALHLWGIKSEIVFCGQANESMKSLINNLAEDLGIINYVHIYEFKVSETLYSDLLVGADIGLQFRTYYMGGLSGALNDCIAAGLPTIANEHLAEAMDAPNFVERVTDNLSPIIIAETVLKVLNKGPINVRPLNDAKLFASRHSPKVYCVELLNALGLKDSAFNLKAKTSE